MRTTLSCITHFSLCIFAVFLLTACDSEPPVAEKETEPQVRPAKLLTVGQATSKEFLNYPAVIQYQQSSVLSFEVGGMVAELPVTEAQQVKKGDILAKLDQRDLLAKLESARAQFDNAETTYQRAERLMKEDAISRKELEERKSQRDVSKSQLDTAEKALGDTVLVAPYSGAIAKVWIEKRQLVQPGEPAITTHGGEGLEAKIDVPSSIIAKARKQTGPRETYLVLDAAPDRRIPARYREISMEADVASQTYEATFVFEAPEDLVIFSGMNAIVWIEDPSTSTTDMSKIRIPLTAIATDGDQQYVWVVDSSSMSVSKRAIVLDPGVGTSLSVISGLEVGETIVAAGVSALSEGMKVSPWSK